MAETILFVKGLETLPAGDRPPALRDLSAALVSVAERVKLDIYSDLEPLPTEISAAAEKLKTLAPRRRGRAKKSPSYMALTVDTLTASADVVAAVILFAPYSIHAEFWRGPQEVGSFHDTSCGADLPESVAAQIRADALLPSPLTLQVSE